VRFVDQNRDDLPLGDWVATRKQYFEALAEVAKRARETAVVYYCHQRGEKRDVDYQKIVASLQASLVDLEKIGDHLAALGEGVAIPG